MTDSHNFCKEGLGPWGWIVAVDLKILSASDGRVMAVAAMAQANNVATRDMGFPHVIV
jgi:hypothetical protein